MTGKRAACQAGNLAASGAFSEYRINSAVTYNPGCMLQEVHHGQYFRPG